MERLLAAWGLLLGWALFWIGAANPRLYPVWSAPHEEHLRLVAERRGAWTATNVLFAAATIISVGAMWELALVAASPAIAAAAVYTVGAALWLTSLCVRLGPYATLHELAGSTFVAHMVISNAAIAAMGVALLRTPHVAPWSGWVALALGAVAAISLLAGRPRVFGMRSPFEPPASLHIPLAIAGAALLLFTS